MAEVERSSSGVIRLLVLAALVVAGAAVAGFTPLGAYLTREGIGGAIEWLRGSPAAPLIYIVAYAAATALAIPGSILTLAGGAIFGVFGGTLYTTIGANIGANAAFGVGRFLGRDGIRTLVGSRLDALDRATENHGFRGLLTLRLIPVVPFNALNFGSGLTSISWSAYAAATAIGIFPGTVVYTMFADALLAGSQEASREALTRVLLCGALLILLSFLPAIARRVGIRIPGSAAVLAVALFGAQGAQATEVVQVTDAPGYTQATEVAQVTQAGLASEVPAQQLPSHQAFSMVLAGIVHDDGVDYAALVERRAGLDAYVATLAAIEPAALDAADADTRLAFWVNAYNACMLKRVADHYPIQKAGGLLSRIRNTIAGRPANSVWQIPDVFTEAHCQIAGQARSQDDIEHSIIRPMGDPRIHFAVNCAAKSCPVLWPDAYEGETLDAQLDRAVTHFVHDAAHFQVGDDDVIRMNKVLDWFKEDFGGTAGLRTFFAPYLSGPEAALLEEGMEIGFFEYDWTLNEHGR